MNNNTITTDDDCPAEFSATDKLAVEYARLTVRCAALEKETKWLLGNCDCLRNRIRNLEDKLQPPKRVLSQAEYDLLLEAGMDDWAIAEKFNLTLGEISVQKPNEEK